jgi:hypothetical protein
MLKKNSSSLQPLIIQKAKQFVIVNNANLFVPDYFSIKNVYPYEFKLIKKPFVKFNISRNK